jgi:hypothetical protein
MNMSIEMSEAGRVDGGVGVSGGAEVGGGVARRGAGVRRISHCGSRVW